MDVYTCEPQFLKIYEHILIFAGRDVITKNHSHHAIKLLLSFDSVIMVQTESKVTEGNALLLQADVLHYVESKGFTVSIYISPESSFGKRLGNVLLKNSVMVLLENIAKEIKNYVNELITHDHSETAIANYLTNAIVKDIAQIENNYPPDLRISSVIKHIKSNLHKSLDFTELKDIASLSESRLIHLFKSEIGIPIRKYVLWCRLQRAIQKYLIGHNLTQSAHLSGFSDVPHLTRTFVSMLGVSPSHMLKKFN